VISRRSHSSSWDFKTIYTWTPIYSLVSNEASYLEHIAPIYFSIYSVELDLHDRKVYSAHLCYGLTRIKLSFLENLRRVWVVVTGLELLSLACPSLGLGRDYCCTIYTFVTLSLLLLFDPISVENSMW
jgi:hypothetical protein